MTDLIVLVIAAGDGVMTQTREVIGLATNNQVPMIVAINKCDVFGPDAIRRAKESLLREQVLLEEVGGETQAVEVSAKTGMGVDRLLDAVTAQAEIMDLVAPQEGAVKATVIEARMLKGQGATATIIVQEGTLQHGDILVGDESYCRVRSMLDHQGRPVSEALPSDSVEITGWKGNPEIGVILREVESETEAMKCAQGNAKLRTDIEIIDSLKVAEEREKLDDKLWKLINREAEDPAAAPRTVRSYEEVSSSNKLPRLLIILKCDVIGSEEALRKSISEIRSSKCRIEIVLSGVGPITISDVEHAKATGALIIAFNEDAEKSVPLHKLKDLIVKHRIIYQLLDDVKDRMVKLIPPVWKETVIGRAKVLQIFSLSSKKDDYVIGCSVIEGIINRHVQMQQSTPGLPPPESYVQLHRCGQVIHDRLKIKTMRHFKKEISSAGKGMECGILLEDSVFDLEPDDVLVSIQQSPAFDTL